MDVSQIGYFLRWLFSKWNEVLKWAFFCRLNHINKEHVTIGFITKVIKQLEGEAKRVVKDDRVVGHMLLVEFATRPYEISSIISLCKLVTGFFAPLMISTGVDLPAKLLQLNHKELLTQRLHSYDKDMKTKVCKILRMRKNILSLSVAGNFGWCYEVTHSSKQPFHVDTSGEWDGGVGSLRSSNWSRRSCWFQ